MRIRRPLDSMQDDPNNALLGQRLQPDSKFPLGEQRNLLDSERWAYDTGLTGTLPSSITPRLRDAQGRFVAGSYKLRNYESEAGNLSGLYPEVMSGTINPAYTIESVFNRISSLNQLSPTLEKDRISIQHMVRNYEGGDPKVETSYIYSDPVSGLLSATSARNPNTRFAVPSLITPEGQVTNPIDVLFGELSASAASTDMYGIPRHSPIRGLQNIGAVNYNVDEMTPYRNAVLANLAQVNKGFITDDNGERRLAPVYSSDLLQTMQAAPSWYTQGEDHLINQSAIGAMFPQDASGNVLLDNMKRTKSMSRTSGIYEPTPGLAMQRMYEPVRNAGSPYAQSGYVQMTAYGFDSNVAEGSAMASDRLGFVARYKDYSVPLSSAQLELVRGGKNPFEFSEGDVFLHRNIRDRSWLDEAHNRGYASEIPGLPDFEPGSNQFSRIAGINYNLENGTATISVGRYVTALGADNKGQHKTHIMGVDADAPLESNMLRRQITDAQGNTRNVNLDFYAGIPSTSDLQAVGRSINRAKYANNTAGYEQAFVQFATENFRYRSGGLVYKGEEGYDDARQLNAGKAQMLFNRGIVGGLNTMIHARMDQQAIIDNTVLLDPKRLTVSKSRLGAFIAGYKGGDIPINDDGSIPGMKTFAFGGQQYQSYSNVKPLGNDLFEVTAQEMAVVAPTFNYYSQVYDRGRSDIGPDELNQIATANPALYENLRAMEQAGLTYRNYSAEILRSVAANQPELSALRDQMTRSGQIVDISKIDLAGMMADLPAGDGRNSAMLRALANSEYGDKYIRMADAKNSIMAPANAIMNSMIEDESGNIQTGFARSQAELLSAHEAMATEMRLGSVSPLTRERIEETTRYALSSAETLASGEKFQKRAYGMTIPTVGGAISAISGLAINELAMPRSAIYEMFGVYDLDKDARSGAMANIDEQLASGNLSAVVNAFPKTTTNSSDQIFNILDVADVKKRKGMGWISSKETYVSEEAVTAMSKDTDGDRWRQWATRKLAGAANALGFSWIGEQLAATAATRMEARMGIAVNELENVAEAGSRDWQQVLSDFTGILKPGKLLSTLDELLHGSSSRKIKDAMSAFQSKADIGQNYNALYRSQLPFIEMIGQSENIEGFGRLKDAQDTLANYVYQEGTKLKGVAEGSVEFLKDIERSGMLKVGKTGATEAGYYRGDKWQDLGSGWSEISQSIVRSQVTLGMGYEHYDDMIAPAMAQAMLPLREQENTAMHEKLTGLLRAANKTFDPETGLSTEALVAMRDTVGLKHFSDWTVGQKGDMSTVSPQFSHAVGILTNRALKKGEEDRVRLEAGLLNDGALPENARTFAQMYKQVRSARGIIANKDGLLAGVAEGFQAIAGYGSKVFPRYAEAMRNIFGNVIPASVQDLAETSIDMEAPMKHAQAVASSIGTSINQSGSSAKDIEAAKIRRAEQINETNDFIKSNPRNFPGTIHDRPLSKAEAEAEASYEAWVAKQEAAGGSDISDYNAAREAHKQARNENIRAASMGGNSGGSGTVPPTTPPPIDANDYSGGEFSGGGNVYGNHVNFTVTRYGTPPISSNEIISVGSALSSQRMSSVESFIRAGQSIGDISDRGQRNQVRRNLDLYLKAGDITQKFQRRMNDGQSQAADVREFMQATGIDSVNAPGMDSLQEFRAAAREAITQDSISGQRDTDRVGRRQITQREMAGSADAASNLDRMASSIAKLSQETENYTKVGKEHVALIQGASRAYEKVEATLSKLNKIVGDGGTLTEREQALHSRLTDITDGMSGSLPAIRSARNALQDGSLQANPYTSEERAGRVMDALLAGGRSGFRRRSRLSDQDWEAAEEEYGFSRNTLEKTSGLARFSSHAQGLLWAATHLQHNVISPLVNASEYYEERRIAQDSTLLRSGLISYNDMTSGVGGGLLRRQNMGALSRERFGEQIYTAYGDLINGTTNPAVATLAGGLAAIGAPALAGAVVGGQFGGAFGAGVGAAVGLGAGVVNYFNATSQTTGATSRLAQASAGGFQSALDAAISNPLDAFSTVITAIRDPKTYQQGLAIGGANAEFANYFARGGLFVEVASPLSQPATSSHDTRRADAIQALSQPVILMQRDSRASTMISNAMQAWGINRAQAEGGLAEAYATDASVNRYVDKNTALGLYGFMRTYFPDENLAGSQTLRGLEQLSISGLNRIPENAIAAVQSIGQSPFNLGAVATQTQRLTSYYTGISDSGGNLSIAEADVTSAQQRASGINAYRQQSGRRVLDWKTFLYANDPLRDNPAAQQARDSMDTQLSASRINNQPLADAVFGQYVAQQMGRLGAGNLLGFNQAVSGYNTGYAIADSAMQFGMGASQAAGIPLFMSNLNSTRQQQFSRASQGDPYMLSYMANQGLVSSRYATVDMRSGMSIYQDGISPVEYNDIRRMALQTNRTDMMGTPAMMAGGITGMQKSIRDIQVAQAGAQYGYQMQSLQMNLAYSKGMWNLEDAGVSLQRQQQTFGLQQQAQGLGLQEGQFALSGQQFYDRYSLNQRQFQYNAGVQREEMGINRYQQTRRNQWQIEDLAFNRDQSETQFGWQMEDFDRNIRYARGRDRLDLIRQQGRAVISQSMQMGQMDRQEGRANEQIKWEEERFEREKKRFEKGLEFSREEMEMQRKHFEQGRDFDRQRLDMQKQAFEKETAWMKQQWAIEDGQRTLTRQHTIQQTQLQEKMATATYTAQVEIRKYEEAIQVANEAMDRKQKTLALEAQNGELARKIMDQLNVSLNNVSQSASHVANALNSMFNSAYNHPLPTYNRSTVATQFADGGYTGDGARNEPAGVVHKGEYVVPQNGALVVRGESTQQLDLLSRMLRVLERIEGQGPGTVNATIYTNQNQVHTRALTQQDRAYTRAG